MQERGDSMAGLLNIGEMGALALHVLVELTILAEENPEGKRTVQEMAEKLHASVHTLQKVARRLVMLGIVEGTRGVKGGLRLVGDPRKISMLRVIEGVEGKICCNGCMFAKRVCPKGACAFEGITGVLEKNLRTFFATTSLADLAAKTSGPDAGTPAVVTPIRADF